MQDSVKYVQFYYTPAELKYQKKPRFGKALD